jgi:hypothetical protein
VFIFKQLLIKTLEMPDVLELPDCPVFLGSELNQYLFFLEITHVDRPDLVADR